MECDREVGSVNVNEIVWAGVVCLAICCAMFLIVRGKIKRVKVDVGPLHTNIDMQREWAEVRDAVKQINEAVNHRQRGDPTLVERVANLEKQLGAHIEDERTWDAWKIETLTKIAHHVGFVPGPTPKSLDERK